MLENIKVHSVAKHAEHMVLPKDWMITSMPFVNEAQKVMQIHQQMLALERAEKIEASQIVSLKLAVETLMFEVYEKQLFMRRLNSLETLKELTEALSTELTLKEAQMWQVRLANVGMSAKKQALSKQLKKKVAELQATTQKTLKEVWVTELVQSRHKGFINLTSSARDKILEQLMNNEASLEKIDKYIDLLQIDVMNLKKEKDLVEFIEKLEKLPLQSFASYTSYEKEYVAKMLMEQSNFDTIRALEAMISKAYQSYQWKGRVKLADGKEGTVTLLASEVNQLVVKGVISK